MADYFDGSGFGSSLGNKVLPDGDALKRKVDSQRETWLRGISSTKFGKKEDPTYLHFRFIFDFGENSIMDPETFLAPSPLFRSVPNDNDQIQRDAENTVVGLGRGDAESAASADFASRLKTEQSLNGTYLTDTDFFYGSKMVIDSRASQGVFNINGGGVGYMGAEQFLAQRSSKRKQMIKAFKNGLKFINDKCPYYFQSLSGLDQLLKVDIKNFHKPTASKPQRAGTLTVECMESIDMRIFALSELYRKAIYDYTYHRVMLPENLRKFRMWVVVSEIRNIQLTYGINDVLNPFSIPSVAQGANFLDSFNSQSGLLDNTQGLLQKSTNALGINDPSAGDKFGSYTLGPYAFIYQLDQCEFDFDESYPSFSTIDNRGGSAVTNKFKINVGRVKDLKIQFNELADVMQKDDNVKQMVIADTWGSIADGYTGYDYKGTEGVESIDPSSKANPAEYFAQLASNFITNSVADLKDQGVQLLQGAILGNIYGLGGVNPGAALRSAQSVANTVNNFINNGIPNPFKDNTPQGQGLGGPGQRQYPSINEDVYTGNSSTQQQNLGSAYPGSNGSSTPLNEDAYPNNPGTDLGLPDRQYPPSKGDEYRNVPGSDSGVPGRVYPDVIKEDVYTSNPGSDLGVPDRQYPSVDDDQYNNVPGSDLGVPNRVYPSLNDDVYEDNAPDYPGISEDVYPDQSVINTDQIGKIYDDNTNQYSSIGDKEYEETQSVAENNIGDVYDDFKNEYPGVSEKVYKDPPIKSSEIFGDVYDEKPNTYPGVNDKEYDDPSIPNNGINEDVYKGVPGNELGVPSRQYRSINEDAYNQNINNPDVKRIGRIYPSSTNNENN